MKTTIKYSVIGTSWITKSFIQGTQLTEGMLLDGVYSRSKEKGAAFAKDTGAKRVFTDFTELLVSDADLVYVASPNVCHYEQSKALLESGKHVICEKPITVTLSEFKELSTLAREKGLVYFEAIMYMHSPARKILKDAVSEIGEIRSAIFDFSQLSSKYSALKADEVPNIFNPEMKTGALNDLGIYCVYPIVDLFGEPDEIVPSQHFISTGADGCGSAVFKYSDKLITVTYSKVGQSRSASQIMGDCGTVVIGSVSQTDNIYLYDNFGNKTELVPDIDKKYHMANEAQSAYNFITAPENTKSFREECRTVNEAVLRCMEKMRVKNA